MDTLEDAGPLANQVIIVTGGNAGIGLETAIGLARAGAHVVITSRDADRGAAALAHIRARSGTETVQCQQLDLASFGSIRCFTEAFLACHDRLDALVNNAGLILSRRRLTEEGFETMFGVNHLGHWLLTELLLDCLTATGSARVVTVSSAVHKAVRGLDFEDLQAERGFNGWRQYCRSKLANIYFTTELARRLAGTGVTANCLHPGGVDTEFARGGDTHGLTAVGIGLLRPGFVSPVRAPTRRSTLPARPSWSGCRGSTSRTARRGGRHGRPGTRRRPPNCGRRAAHWCMALRAHTGDRDPIGVSDQDDARGAPYPAAMSGHDATEPKIAQQDTERTFDRLVDEGRQRLGRSWSGLVSTGLLGGLDVGIGVLGLLLVEHETGSKLLGGLAFSIGFIALTLARSELFTEDFLVPVAAVVTRDSSPLSLLRLWVVTIVTNLAGGWLITGIIVAGFPALRSTALDAAQFYIDLGVTWRAFALALMGGFLITLMTHMQHSTDSEGVRVVPATVMGFLLGAGQVNHAIVASLVCFAALHAGAPFGYLDWLGLFAFAALGNMIGGIGLVTVLRLLQVPHKVAAERETPAA